MACRGAGVDGQQWSGEVFRRGWVSAVPFVMRVRGKPRVAAVSIVAVTKLAGADLGLVGRFNWSWETKRRLGSRRYCQGRKLYLAPRQKALV
jgi:hypothetical protein